MDNFEAAYARLNPEQQAAVNHGEGRAVVSATAGSGKTTTLTLRAWNLIRNGTPPERLLATTFSRFAAKEIGTRLEKLGAPTELRMGTLHSLCYEILREDGQRFCAGFEVDGKDTLRYALKRIVGDKFRNVVNFKEAVIFIAFAKAAGLWAPEGHDREIIRGLEAVADRIGCGNIAQPLIRVYRLFEEKREESRLLSFDDMLLGAWRTFCEVEGAKENWTGRFDYAIVDEAQDTSTVQYRVVETLMSNTNNLMIVGDLCQSLYSFRGAAPSEFLDFSKHEGCKLYRLPINYRSPKEITEPASTLVRGKAWNLSGDIVPVQPGPGYVRAHIYEDPEDEAHGLVQDIKARLQDGARPGDFYVLFRLNAIAQPIESELVRAGIPYRLLSGTGFYGRREIKDMLAYLRVVALQDPRGTHAKRIVNVPFRYIGKVTVNEIETFAETEKISFLDACALYRGRPAVNNSLKELLTLVRELNALVVANKPAGDVLEKLLDRTQYTKWLERDDVDDDAESDRVANVMELLRVAKAFPNVSQLLAYVDATERALEAARAAGGNQPDVVSLMSIWKAKGLENEHVYVAGAVTGIMPHAKAQNTDEERRVMFVALTRAKNSCTFGCPKTTLYGKAALPSPFLIEMGVEIVGLPSQKALPEEERKALPPVTTKLVQLD